MTHPHTIGADAPRLRTKTDTRCDPAKVRACFDYTGGRLYWRVRTGPRCQVGQAFGGPDDRGYICGGLFGRIYKEHALVWAWHTGSWPAETLDHMNGVKSDNRIENLRDVPHEHNTQNRVKPRKGSASGVQGVTIVKGRKPYLAQLGVGRDVWRLGRYATAEEAHAAYLVAKRATHAGCTI